MQSSFVSDQIARAPSVERGADAVKPPILEVRGLSKVYRNAGHELTVLRDVHLTLQAGDTCAIIGPSGSGKTTLLGLCAGLDDATSGSVHLDGEELGALDEDARAALRNRAVGFVFQNFQLIPTLTAIENVLVPLELRGESGRQHEAAKLLGQVGLADRLDHYPLQLSGGEQQRVALARAFIHRPRILFADEPTGNLDAETSGPIVEMLFELNREAGTALVLVTHDPALAARARRVVKMRGGAIVEQEEHAASL
jgi:putative ABC transport system ATP-binding protein